MRGRRRLLLVCALLVGVLVVPTSGLGAGSPCVAVAAGACHAPTADSRALLDARTTQVAGPAAEPDPDIVVDETAVDFGEVSVGETATVTIRNDGEGTLRVKELAVSGDEETFTLVYDGSGGTDDNDSIETSPTFTVASGESEQVSILFTPSDAGSYEATLTVDSDDPDTPTTTVSLAGEGETSAQPDFGIDARTLAFDDVTVDEQSVRELTVSNTGDADLVVEDQSIAPAGTGFEILTPVSGSLAPGESETLTVAFEPTSRAARAATLSLGTNDPAEGTAYISLTSTRADANVSVNRSTNATALSATVENATAGEPVELAVPADPADPNSTDIESVALTPATNGSFALAVDSSTEPPASASTFDSPSSTDPDRLGNLNISHSIPNENISNVTVRYRVNRSTMASLESEPEDFSLYRQVDGRWTRVDTTLVRETDRSYVFEGTATGFSEWTAATEVPRIAVADATANVTAVTTEETVEIRVLLNNTGGSDGRFEVELLLNGSTVERRDVAVAPTSTSLVTFQRGFDQAGTYGVTVNDFFVAAVEVSEGDARVIEGTGTAAAAGDTGSSPLAPGLVLPAVGTVLALLGSLVLYRLLAGGESAAGGGDPPDHGDDADGGDESATTATDAADDADSGDSPKDADSTT